MTDHYENFAGMKSLDSFEIRRRVARALSDVVSSHPASIRNVCHLIHGENMGGTEATTCNAETGTPQSTSGEDDGGGGDGDGDPDPEPELPPQSARYPAATIRRPQSSPRDTARLLRLSTVSEKIGLGRSTIYERLDSESPRHDPDFPTPISLGTGRNAPIAWLESEVDAYIALLIRRTRAPESRDVITPLAHRSPTFAAAREPSREGVPT